MGSTNYYIPFVIPFWGHKPVTVYGFMDFLVLIPPNPCGLTRAIWSSFEFWWSMYTVALHISYMIQRRTMEMKGYVRLYMIYIYTIIYTLYIYNFIIIISYIYIYIWLYIIYMWYLQPCPGNDLCQAVVFGASTVNGSPVSRDPEVPVPEVPRELRPGGAA
jgi:hypothetical protein